MRLFVLLDRLCQIAGVGVELGQRDVPFDDVERREIGSLSPARGGEVAGQRRLHLFDPAGAVLADQRRILIPAGRLLEAADRRLHLGEAVDADRRLDRGGRRQRERRSRRRRRPALDALDERVAGGQCQHPHHRARPQFPQRLAQRRVQLGQLDRADQAALRRRRIDRRVPGQRREVAAASQPRNELIGALGRADDDDPERHGGLVSRGNLRSGAESGNASADGEGQEPRGKDATSSRCHLRPNDTGAERW